MASRAVSGESGRPCPGAFFTGANSSSRRTSNSAVEEASGKVSKMKSSSLTPCGAGQGTQAGVARGDTGRGYDATLDQQPTQPGSVSSLLHALHDPSKHSLLSRRAPRFFRAHPAPHHPAPRGIQSRHPPPRGRPWRGSSCGRCGSAPSPPAGPTPPPASRGGSSAGRCWTSRT